MDITTLFKADERRVDERNLTERQQSFLKKIRQHDGHVHVSRTAGKLLFHGPMVGVGPMPSAGRDA
jgi:methionyl-tRNA formyltransferase